MVSQEETGVRAEFILARTTQPRIINTSNIDWEEVKAETTYRFLKVMKSQGRVVDDDNIAELMTEEINLLRQCYAMAKGDAFRRGGVIRRRVVSDDVDVLLSADNNAITQDSWESRAFEEIEEDWEGEYQEMRANAKGDLARAMDLMERALSFVDDGLPIPGYLRQSISQIRKRTNLPLNLRMLSA